MVGLIWTIHTVHYPLFTRVGANGYTVFQAEHVERIGRLLLVPWATEGVAAALILLYVVSTRDRDAALPTLIASVAMGIVLIISGFWSAPAHAELADGFDPDVHARLMTADLIRTLAWTVRGACAIWITAVAWRRRPA